jgi:Pyridoxamine 5'-phosphate oxidase
MNDAAHVYTRAETSATLPAQVARYLDGNDLLAKTQALRISTVDAEGWPHASLLSAGDMLALPSGRIRFVVFPQSTTTANMMRDGRATVTLSLDGGMCELRMTCLRLAHGSSDIPLAFFEGELITVRVHKAPYAAISGGVTFTLHEPQSVLPRWQKQIAAMKTAT